MKDECCHQHPDNGSDLALQTESQRAKTDLRAVNAQLLEALEDNTTLLERVTHEVVSLNHRELIEGIGLYILKAREAIKEARK